MAAERRQDGRGQAERERWGKKKTVGKCFFLLLFCVCGRSERAEREARLRLKDRVSDFTAANLRNYVVMTGLLSLGK